MPSSNYRMSVAVVFEIWCLDICEALCRCDAPVGPRSKEYFFVSQMSEASYWYCMRPIQQTERAVLYPLLRIFYGSHADHMSVFGDIFCSVCSDLVGWSSSHPIKGCKFFRCFFWISICGNVGCISRTAKYVRSIFIVMGGLRLQLHFINCLTDNKWTSVFKMVEIARVCYWNTDAENIFVSDTRNCEARSVH
jgi:hypothetical protein